MTMIDDDDGGEGGVMINNTNLMMKGYNVAKCLPTQSTRSFVQQLKIMSATALKDLAKKLPKTEVHLHLDGSLSAEFICKRAKVRNIKLGVDKSNLRTFLHSRKQVQIADGNKQKIKGNWGIYCIDVQRKTFVVAKLGFVQLCILWRDYLSETQFNL